MFEKIDKGKRNFIQGTILTLASAGLPKILLAHENDFDVYSYPKFKDIDGKTNYCARYVILASKYKFGNCFQWKDAWQFADFNESVQKIEKMQENNFNDYIRFFIEKDVLKPGMIVGTFYNKSSWNYKFYTEEGNTIWKGENDYYKKNGKVWTKVNFNKDEISKLKPINYTHLMCYAGKGINEEPIFWHQFPYPKKDMFGDVIRNKKTGKIEKEVLQTNIRLDELEENGLYVKEIIDVPKELNRRHLKCEEQVKILGYGGKK